LSTRALNADAGGLASARLAGSEWDAASAALVPSIAPATATVPIARVHLFTLSTFRRSGHTVGSGDERTMTACHRSFILIREDRNMRVLIVEDELRMAGLLRRGLVNEGVAADVAQNGEEALWMAPAHDYDAIVLDVMLPGLDGFEVCRRLRAAGVWSPVLMLTARDAVEDRVAGLDSGADDYLVKPFAFAELLARLRALVRRGDSERPSILRVGDLRLDPATRDVRRGSIEISLSAKEFALLEVFMRRPGEVLSRLHLLEHAWDFAYENRSNIVDVYVRRLRAKIDVPFARHSLETIRGAGYRLRSGEGP
jgi:two-component system OmpR family response regulator